VNAVSVLLFYRDAGRGGGGGMGFAAYGGMMPSVGRAGNVHPQAAGSSARPGSAGSAPGASFAEPFNFVSCVCVHVLVV